MRWLSEQVEAEGVDRVQRVCRTRGAARRRPRVIGVRTGDRGIAKDGSKKSEFEPGVEILAKVTIFCDGVRGNLTKEIVRQAGSVEGPASRSSTRSASRSCGRSRQGRIEPGTVIHSLGYPLLQDQFGGGFIYAMPQGRISLGFVVGLDYHDPLFDPHMAFNRFKQHPFVSSLLKDGTLIRYGAKALPEGGWNTIPQTYMDGGLIAGDAGGFLNSMRLKGIHLAMRTGMLAAEAAFEAIREGDTSAASLKRYQDKIDAGPVRAELYPVRNVHQAFGYGLFAGLAFAGLSLATGGRWFENLHGKPGHERMKMLAWYYGLDVPGIANQQRDDHRSEADVRQGHERSLLRNRPRRGPAVAPAGADRGVQLGLRTRSTAIRASASARRTSTRSSASPASPCVCRSMRPTACTARRATSWIPTR